MTLFFHRVTSFKMPPTSIPNGLCFSDTDTGGLSEVGEATTQTEDPFLTLSSTSFFANPLSSSNYTSTDEDVSEADSVIERLTRSVGRFFSRVRIVPYVHLSKRMNYVRVTVPTYSVVKVITLKTAKKC